MTAVDNGNLLRVRVTADLQDWLTDRAALTQESAALRLRTEAALLRGLLQAELARQRWTLPELGLIADVCNGLIVSTAIGNQVLVEVIDAFALDPDVWGEKWGVDEDALVSKLRVIGPTAAHALADAVAAWWATQADHDDANSAEGWARVGVRVVP